MQCCLLCFWAFSPIPFLAPEQCPVPIPACLISFLCPAKVPGDQLGRSSEAGQLGARFHLQQHPGEVQPCLDAWCLAVFVLLQDLPLPVSAAHLLSARVAPSQ